MHADVYVRVFSVALEAFNTVDEVDLRRRDFRRDSYYILHES